MDLATGEERFAFPLFRGHDEEFHFDRDGARLAAGSHKGGITVWDLATGKATLKFPKREHTNSGVDFSPDGRTIAVIESYEEVVLRDSRSGEELLRLEDHLLVAPRRAPPAPVRSPASSRTSYRHGTLARREEARLAMVMPPHLTGPSSEGVTLMENVIVLRIGKSAS